MGSASITVGDDRPGGPGPLTMLTCGWIAGIGVGSIGGSAQLWLAAATIPVLVMLSMAWRRCWRGARCWGLAATVLVSAAWSVGHMRQVSGDDIRRYIGQEYQLAELTGQVASTPALSDSRRGAFGAFNYRSPATIFTLDVDSIVIKGTAQPARGRLLVKINAADQRLRRGQRVGVIGWLGAIQGPSNPGEYDYRRALARRQIYGRINLSVRGNCRLLEPLEGQWWGRSRRALSEVAARALHIGLRPDSREASLLDAVILGRRYGSSAPMYDLFRRVGLAHILSISGAHLAILLAVVWLLVRLWVHHPRHAALVVLAVLGLYLFLVPARVPIIRAGIMASVFCLGIASGRSTRRIELLALACLLVLVWRPGDLLSAGFQLSFGVVGGLMRFTGPVGQWLWADPPVKVGADQMHQVWLRRCADYLAWNVVAFAVAAPLVAYHFQMLTPLTILLSVMALPVITAVLTLGYLKILLGLILPSVGLMLAGPLTWVTDVMWSLVEHAATWRGATIELPGTPSVAWTAAMLGIVVAWMSGWFVRRRVVMALVLTVAVLWLGVLVVPPQARPLAWLRPSPPVMRLNMFAVGNGSCYLVQLWGKQPGDRYTLMYDCGSQEFPEVGIKSIVPALRRLGVSRIDTLVISHADIDHYGGSLDLAEAIPIGRVVVPPQLLAEARAWPDSALALLVRSLGERGVPLEIAAQGFSETQAGALIQMLWPPADLVSSGANDTSLVLSIRTPASTGAAHRLLLNGDIQKQATLALLEAGIDLRADVTDLPHHGGINDASSQWLQRVAPKMVLQSSRSKPPARDHWPSIINTAGIMRLATADSGMVQIDFNHDGTIQVTRYKSHRAPPVHDRAIGGQQR